MLPQLRYRDEAAPTKRSKVQLLCQLAQQCLAPNQAVTEDQVDLLRLSIGAVPLSELCLERSEQCPLPDPSRPKAIGHHMDWHTDAQAAEQLKGHSRHAPIVSWTRPPITYLHIFEDSTISLGVFCLPALSQIPLHDHPGMTVFTRVLYGQVHYMAYDWEDPSHPADFDCPAHARLVKDRTFSAPDDPTVLFPRANGNLHQLTALTDCAVLSLLCPPYNPSQGRDCHYYKALETREGELEPGEVLLEERDPPRDFYIGCGKYRGVVPAARGRPPSPTTPLLPSCPSADSYAGSPQLGAACSLATAAAAAVAAAEKARGDSAGAAKRRQPCPDSIPIPQSFI
ncbi:hypothetical protein N2152v2_011294 [Parachlorella kessleri]